MEAGTQLMKPHVCPKCLGEGTVLTNDTRSTSLGYRKCPVCKGSGVLWGPDASPITPIPEPGLGPFHGTEDKLVYGTGIFTFGPAGERIFHHHLP